MTDVKDPTNGQPDTDAKAERIEAQIIGQYIKDLSFENPHAGKPIKQKDDTPKLDVQVSVNAKRAANEYFESAIDLKAVARNSEGTIYDLELVYAGLFRIRNVPGPALEPFLLIHCPSLIFPFARRLVADITREGSFPPLLLDPIDFAALYAQNREQAAKDSVPGSIN